MLGNQQLEIFFFKGPLNFVDENMESSKTSTLLLIWIEIMVFKNDFTINEVKPNKIKYNE